MKRHWKSGSDLIERLFDNVEQYKTIEENCYKTCNDILSDKTVDIDELYHAKAVLEQKIEAKSNSNDFACISLSLVAVDIAALSLGESVLNGMFGTIGIILILTVLIVVCVIIYYFVTRSPIKDYLYYVHSLICNEIENRNNESGKLDKKTNRRNKNKKGKNKCQSK